MPPQKKTEVPQYTVIQDTREQLPWKFVPGKDCLECTVAKLDIADYTLEGLSDKFLIERKLSVSEISKNMIGKDYERFERELVRLNEVEHAYLVMEFTLMELLQYPWGEKSLPLSVKRKIKLTGKFILKKLLQLEMKFPRIKFVFAGPRGKEFAAAIFSEMYQLYLKK